MRRARLLALCLLATNCSNRAALSDPSVAPTVAPTAAPPVAMRPVVQRFAEGALPPPEFTDPNRKAKLETAFPAIDKIFGEWREKNHVPGLAVGVVIVTSRTPYALDHVSSPSPDGLSSGKPAEWVSRWRSVMSGESRVGYSRFASSGGDHVRREAYGPGPRRDRVSVRGGQVRRPYAYAEVDARSGRPSATRRTVTSRGW
jgi:hypothetical protein